MAWKTVQYRWTSSAPLIMHNGQTADPLNKWAKLMKKITAKKNKTDADYEELARLEFLAGLYMGPQGPVIPTKVIDGIVLAGAKKFNEGPVAKSACFCTEYAPLEYEGPKTAEDLWADDSFRFAELVRVQRNRVVRMRPIFKTWATTVSLNVEDTLVDISRVDEWMRVAGPQIGACDWRPQYGRFTAERLNGK